MRRAASVFAIALLLVAPAARGGDGEALRLLRTIPLPGVEGRIDHLVRTPDGKRLVLAALGNDTVEVVDLEKGQVAGRIRGQHEPQGVGVLAGAGGIVVAGGDDGVVRRFDPSTLAEVAAVPLGSDADNLRVEASGARFWVGYGDGGIAAIEGDKVVQRVPLAAHPEAFQLETSGTRVFVNVPGAERVAVVDRAKGAVIASWGLSGARSNFPMALDEATHRLFVGCRSPARLLVLDTTTGRTVASVEISGDVDDVFLDAKANRLYLSCGEGWIDVVERGDGDAFRRASRTETARGARTSLLDADGGRLWLAVPHRGGQPAELREYATKR
jgi:DNA-binding beta-propeller fold protein YncE